MDDVQKWWVNARHVEKVNIILGQMLIERREQDARPDEAEVEKRNSHPNLKERFEYDGIFEEEAVRERKSSIPIFNFIPPDLMRRSWVQDKRERIPWKSREWLQRHHRELFDKIFIPNPYLTSREMKPYTHGDVWQHDEGWETLPETWKISMGRAELLKPAERFHEALECLHEAKTDIETKIKELWQTLPSTPEDIYVLSNYPLEPELPDNWGDIKDEYRLENISHGETTYREFLGTILHVDGLEEYELKWIEEQIDELEKIIAN